MLDNLGQKILSVLIDDSRLSYRKIAKKLGVSTATVISRIKGLEKENVILSYTAVLDHEKLGYDIEVMIEIRISKGRLLDVERKIATDPNVFAVYDVTGDFDAVVLARFKNRRAMDNFIKKLQTYNFVERTNTKMILHSLKRAV